MMSTRDIAEFVVGTEYDRLPDAVREATKRRLLDALAVGLHHRDDASVDAVRRGIATDRGSAGRSRVWGTDLTVSAPRTAMANAASVAAGNAPTFLSPTPAPAAGSIAAVLAVADDRGATGEETIAGLAAALELHGELAWRAPLDELHPATHTAVAATAGVGRITGLDVFELSSALGNAASRVTLGVGDDAFVPIATGTAALEATYACLLADGGVDAADSMMAKNGWHDLVGPFDLDFDPGCERVRDAAILPYDASPYEQSAIGAAIELADRDPLDPADIDAVTVETVDDAEPAVDPERIAAALVDRELFVHRATREDIRPVLDAVTVTADGRLTEQAERGTAPVRVSVEYRDESTAEVRLDHFNGHPATPASWGTVADKFHVLSEAVYGRERRERIVRTVRTFEAESADELARLLDRSGRV
ncbi:MAG: MmgE/PrpD family protein [Halobacteriota archaeon]|uniref:MmgE/PrpD family protein n=1 Tax=Natronomonas sp. TaxID=2184060 RepID=UPI003975B9DD